MNVMLPRLKSIDTFRGLCMSWMILGHLSGWWIRVEDFQLAIFLNIILDSIGSSGFLFIAGLSTMLSHRKKLIIAKNSEQYSKKTIRNEYFFRALFILIIALIYNLSIAITLTFISGENNFPWVWSWFILLTISISLFIAWPLLKIPKLLRLVIGIIIWIVNNYIFNFLVSYMGQANAFGVLFYILYNGYELDPILSFFPFFLIGTVVGEVIYELLSRYNSENKIRIFRNNFIIPSLLIGVGLVTFNVLFQFPKFLMRWSLPWLLYTIGIDLILFSGLFTFEIYGFMEKEKSYRFLFYYSFYSLTIYLAHNILYFLFLKQLNQFNLWFFIAGAFIAIGLLLMAIYKKSGEKASLKYHLSRLSIKLAKRIECKKISKVDIIE